MAIFTMRDVAGDGIWVEFLTFTVFLIYKANIGKMRIIFAATSAAMEPQWHQFDMQTRPGRNPDKYFMSISAKRTEFFGLQFYQTECNRTRHRPTSPYNHYQELVYFHSFGIQDGHQYHWYRWRISSSRRQNLTKWPCSNCSLKIAETAVTFWTILLQANHYEVVGDSCQSG